MTSTQAVNLVNRLLESDVMSGTPERACHDCEREHYGAPVFGKSHSQCRRHFIAWAKRTGYEDAQIAELVAIQDANPKGWVPDLGPVEGAQAPPPARSMFDRLKSGEVQ